MRYLTEVRGLTKAEAELEVDVFVDGILNYFSENKISVDDWADKQAYVALGVAVSAAVLLGVGSSPVGSKPKILEPILQRHKLIGEDQHVAVVASFGYPRDERSYAHLGTGKRVRVAKELKFKQI